jgi:hypothetical protein
MRSLQSELTNRKLRFDGVSEVEPDQLGRFLLLGVPPSKLRVLQETPDVVTFNAQVPAEDQIQVGGQEPIALDMGWELPEKYQTLDLEEYIASQFEERCPTDYTPEQVEEAIDRIAFELDQVNQRGMVEFMRTIIYILDQLRANDVVWGVGRGSSCACYLLFIIGLHVVDCVKMNVSAEEFFHE